MLCPCSAILCELQLPLRLLFSCTFIHYFWTHSQCSNATYNSQRGTSNSIGPILKCTCERGASKFKKAAIPQLAGGLASHCSSSASIASHNVLHPELSSGTANFQLSASNNSRYTAKKPWESSPNPSKQETPWSKQPFWALNSKYILWRKFWIAHWPASCHFL